MIREESAVIKSIYNTLTDEANWRETLDYCSDFVGARSAGLVVTEYVGTAPYEDRYLSSLYHSVDPEKLQHYRDHLRKYEHMAWDILKALPPQTILSDDDYRDQVAQQEDFVFFREVLGVDRRMVCRINDHPAWFDALAFQFDSTLNARPAGCEEKYRLILPHLAHSLQIGRTFWRLQRQYKMVLGVLNHVKIGLCVVHKGELVVVNQAAENILHLSDGISRSNKSKIKFQDAEIQAEFDCSLEDVSRTARGEGDRPSGTFTIERPSGRQSYLVDVRPIRDSLGEVANNLAGALVSVIDPAETQKFDYKRFRDVFQLTEAEVSVAKLIVQGSSNQEIADERSVSEKTVKNQATSIYRKTNAESCADLVRKIVMTTPPIILE